MTPKEPTRSQCMKCGNMFNAEHRFNRICKPCTKLNNKLGGRHKASNGAKTPAVQDSSKD